MLLAAGVVLGVVGNSVFKGNVTIGGSVTQSGSTAVSGTGYALKIGKNGASRYTEQAYVQGTLTGSGGANNYTSCAIPYPSDKLDSSGAYLNSVEVKVTNAPVGSNNLWCGFVKALANSGSMTNFQRVAIQSGSLLRFSTGASLKWTASGGRLPGDIFKCVTSLAPGALTGVCRVRFRGVSGS